jgi:hypothetical protein
MAAMGVAETVAIAGLGLTVLGFAGALTSSGVKALWSISTRLGQFEGQILQMLKNHKDTLDDHEDRLRSRGL